MAMERRKAPSGQVIGVGWPWKDDSDVLNTTALLKAGFSVKLLDQRAHIITEQALKDHLSSDTICVGISTMTGTQIRYHYAGGGLLNVNPRACRIG